MRPGRLTPENSLAAHGDRHRRAGFNEAGAINPGKQKVEAYQLPRKLSFNEAGAINPGKRLNRR